MIRSTRDLPVLALAAIAACVSPAAPPRPLDADEAEPIPARLAWLGIYDGSADGVERGRAFLARPVRLVLALGGPPDCENTLDVRFESAFAGCGFDVSSTVFAEFAYRTDSTQHRLLLDRFSGGGQVGNVLLGSIRVDWLDTARSRVPLLDATFTVVKR